MRPSLKDFSDGSGRGPVSLTARMKSLLPKDVSNWKSFFPTSVAVCHKLSPSALPVAQRLKNQEQFVHM